MDHVERLADLVAEVEADEASFRVFSHGEQIAVAAALDRVDLLKACGVTTIAQAKDRLGPDWWRAVLAVKAGRLG